MRRAALAAYHEDRVTPSRGEKGKRIDKED